MRSKTHCHRHRFTYLETLAEFLIDHRNEHCNGSSTEQGYVRDDDAQAAVHGAIACIAHTNCPVMRGRVRKLIQRMFERKHQGGLCREKVHVVTATQVMSPDERMQVIANADPDDAMRTAAAMSLGEPGVTDVVAESDTSIKAVNCCGDSVTLLRRSFWPREFDPHPEGIEIVTDNFLTGRRFGFVFGPQRDNRGILLERPLNDEQPGVDGQPAGRTALLAALCADAPSIAEMLIMRQCALSCEVKDSRSHAYDHAAVKLTASRGRKALLSAGYVWAAQHPDVCCVNDPCGPGGLTALRLAAALGLANLVGLLRDCPSCLVGAYSGTRSRPTPRLEVAVAALRERSLPLDRTVFHDIARADVVRRTAEPGERTKLTAQLHEYVDKAFDAVDVDDKQHAKLAVHQQLMLARVIVKLHKQILRTRTTVTRTPLRLASSTNVKAGPTSMKEKERAHLEETFKMFDKDNSGSITTQELAIVMRNFNHGKTLAEAEVAHIVREVDANGDGTIDMDEFFALMNNEMSASQEVEVVLKKFKEFERHDSEFISAAHVKDALSHIGDSLHDHEIEDMFRNAGAGEGDASGVTYEKLMARAMPNSLSGENDGVSKEHLLPSASPSDRASDREIDATHPITMQSSHIMLSAMGRALLTCDERGRLAIHYAAARGNSELLGFLIKQHAAAEADQIDGALGESLNKRDALGWTPLALAVMHGHLKCARLLLDQGGCPRARSSHKSPEVNVPCALDIGLMHLKQLADEDRIAERQDNNEPGGSTFDGDQHSLVTSAEEQKKHAQRDVLTTSEKKDKREKRRIMTHKLLGAMLELSSNAKVFRSTQIVSDQFRSGCMYLIWLCLLTFVALCTTSGFISNGRFLLNAQHGDLVPGNDFPDTYGGLDTYDAHVQDVESLNDWMQEVLFDTLFPDDTGFINTHNVLVGALRLRQQRQQVKADGCDEEVDRPIIGRLSDDAVCFEGDKWFRSTLDYDSTMLEEDPIELGALGGNGTNESIVFSYFVQDGVNSAGVYQPWFDQGATMAMGQKRAFWAKPYSTAGHIIDIPPGNASRAAAIMQLIIDSGWIDEATTRVVFADWTTYNWRLKELVVSHLVIELPKTGGASPASEVVVMPTVPSEVFDAAERLRFIRRPPWIAFGRWPRLDFVQWAELSLMVFNFFYFLGELNEMRHYKNYCEHIFENAFDLISDVLTSAWCGFRIIWYVWALSLKVSPDDSNYHGEFQTLAHLFTTARALICISLIVAWLKLTKYVRLLPYVGPRLSAALSTITQPEVIIFSLLFSVIAMIFGIACTVAFGTTVDGFSSLFPSAFLTIFVLFFGDWDYEELQSAAEPGWLGTLLFFGMVIFGFAIMGNIFIAVIGNAYDDIVKTSMENWENEVNERLAEGLWKRLLRRGGTTGREHGGGTKRQRSTLQAISNLFGGDVTHTDSGEYDLLDDGAAAFLGKRYDPNIAKRNADSHLIQLLNSVWARCTGDVTLCTVTHKKAKEGREGDKSFAWLHALASPSSDAEEEEEEEEQEEEQEQEAGVDSEKLRRQATNKVHRSSVLFRRREMQRQHKREQASELYSLVRLRTPEGVGANFDCEHLFHFDWRQLPEFDSAVLEDELKEEEQRQRESVNIQLEYLRTRIDRLVQQLSQQQET